ncbi:MAG: glycosyltransferase family 1 protein [Candidatus Bathyarchaeia archaeon]
MNATTWGERKLKSALKVFVVFFHPKTSVTALGGAEKRFIETLKVFCKEDSMEITVVEAPPSLLEKRKIACRKVVVPLNFRKTGWLGTYLEWSFWIVKAFFKGFPLLCQARPNVILVPNNTLPNLACSFFVGLVSRTPTCVVVHHFDSPFSTNKSKKCSLFESYRKIGYSRLVSLVKSGAFYVSVSILKRADAMIAVSNFTAKVLKNCGVLKVKIFVSGNAVNLNLINKAKPCFKEKIFDGVFVGRIAKEKGIFDLLKIWKNVAKAKRNAKLLIIGNGIEFPAVKKEVSNLGLEENVFLRGGCGEAELFGLLKSSKLFVFPSLFEGWGLAVAEALACGLPVIAYDIPALREIFGACKSVFLVPARNVEGMAATVLDILNLSEKEISRLKGYSEAFSRQFSWEDVARKDLELLKTFKK